MIKEYHNTIEPENPWGDFWECVFMFVVASLLLIVMSGCTTCRTIETVKTNDVYHHVTDTIRDSIYNKVYEKEYLQGDTVYKVKTEYLYKDRWKIKSDTVLVHDTITQSNILTETKEVDKTSWWNKIQIATWNWLAIVVIGVVVFFFLKRGS